MATQIDPVPSARERHAPPAPRLASQRVRPDLDNAVVFVAGKDPLEETGGGHSTLLRAHGRAALRAGFVPHLFGVGRSVGVVETDYGVVHRLRSPFWRLRQLPGVGFRTHMAVWHAPLISRSVERFVMAGPRPRLIHGFGVWGGAAVTASRRLGRRGIPIAPIVSAYVDRLTRRAREVDWVSGACLLVRRADAEAVGLMDERYFMYAEDVDFCASMRARGRTVRFHPDAQVVHLRGRSAVSMPRATEAAYRRSQIAFYSKHHPRWVPLLRAYLKLRGRLPDNQTDPSTSPR